MQSNRLRDVWIEASIDAMLVDVMGCDIDGYARARDVGTWCERIASALPHGWDSSSVGHVGTLADADPAELDRIPELEHLAPYVRAYQSYAMEESCGDLMTLVVAAAEELCARISHGGAAHPIRVIDAARSMSVNARGPSIAVAEALSRSLRFELKRG